MDVVVLVGAVCVVVGVGVAVDDAAGGRFDAAGTDAGAAEAAGSAFGYKYYECLGAYHHNCWLIIMNLHHDYQLHKLEQTS